MSNHHDNKLYGTKYFLTTALFEIFVQNTNIPGLWEVFFNTAAKDNRFVSLFGYMVWWDLLGRSLHEEISTWHQVNAHYVLWTGVCLSLNINKCDRLDSRVKAHFQKASIWMIEWIFVQPVTDKIAV